MIGSSQMQAHAECKVGKQRWTTTEDMHGKGTPCNVACLAAMASILAAKDRVLTREED